MADAARRRLRGSAGLQGRRCGQRRRCPGCDHTAALFLRHFAGGLPWAHLDLASVGDSPADEHEWTKGATGFGARALLHWLELPDPLAGITAATTPSP